MSKHGAFIAILLWCMSASTKADVQIAAPRLIALEKATVRLQTAIPCLERSGSGFLYPDTSHVVTALHVVSDCPTIGLSFPQITSNGVTAIQRTAHVIAVRKSADLAYLAVSDPPSGYVPMRIDPVCPSVRADPALVADHIVACAAEGEAYLKIGYSRGNVQPEPGPLTGECCLRGTIGALLEDQEKDALRAIGFPALALPILDFNGVIVQGDSGGPILNAHGDVVGVSDGGVGVAGYDFSSWGIPSAQVRFLVTSNDRIGDSDYRRLFAAFKSIQVDTPTQASTVKVWVSGTRYNLAALTDRANRTFVDVFDGSAVNTLATSLVSALGGTLAISPDGLTIDVSKPGADATFVLGSQGVTINGEKRPLESPPFRYNGRAFIPLEVTAQVLGDLTSFDPASLQEVISTNADLQKTVTIRAHIGSTGVTYVFDFVHDLLTRVTDAKTWHFVTNVTEINNVNGLQVTVTAGDGVLFFVPFAHYPGPRGTQVLLSSTSSDHWAPFGTILTQTF